MRLILLFVLALAGTLAYGQNILLLEDFETDGNGTRYTTSITEFTDDGVSSGNDYFIRTDGSDISGSVSFTNTQGSSFFAAQDIDGEGADPLQTLSITGINISDNNMLTFSIFLAEDDDGSNEDWDGPDFFQVEYSVDGGANVVALAVESETSVTNGAPRIDTDFDGIGDGTEITDAFQMFSVAIPETGDLLDLTLTFRFDSGDEDIAIDDVMITGESVLPVELTALSARPMPKSVMVKWATASEDGSDFFAVERSTDAGRTFTEIGRTRAAGDSRDEQRYELEDFTPVKGQTLYRLRAVDLDGSFEYSDQVIVDFAGTTGVSVFPNPVSTELKVAGLDATVTEATLITTSGSQRVLPVTNGNVNVSALRPGVYFLRVAGSDAPVRFVKQ